METKKNDYLVEFELQDSEMSNISGGAAGTSQGVIYNGMWCAKDWGDTSTQKISRVSGCEPGPQG